MPFLPLLDSVPVVDVLLLLLWYSGCTWRKIRHGGHDLDRGRVEVVDDAKGLLPVPVRDCCVVICVSRLPLPPLSDCVPVVAVVVAAAVVFQLHLEGRACWQ